MSDFTISETVLQRINYLVCKTIELLAMLDGAKEEKAEARNREPIAQTIVIGLGIMKQREGQEIRTEIGDKCDEKKHRG